MLFHLWTGVRNFNDEIDKILDGSPVAAILYATGWIGVFGITTAGVLLDSFAFTTISDSLYGVGGIIGLAGGNDTRRV